VNPVVNSQQIHSATGGVAAQHFVPITVRHENPSPNAIHHIPFGRPQPRTRPGRNDQKNRMPVSGGLDM
jgi:hypothetical protein